MFCVLIKWCYFTSVTVLMKRCYNCIILLFCRDQLQQVQVFGFLFLEKADS